MFSGHGSLLVDFLLVDEENRMAWDGGGSSRIMDNVMEIEGRSVVHEFDSRDGHLSDCEEEEALNQLVVERGYESNVEVDVGKVFYWQIKK